MATYLLKRIRDKLCSDKKVEIRENREDLIAVFQNLPFGFPAFRVTECPADTRFIAKQLLVLPGDLAETGSLLLGYCGVFRDCFRLMGTTGHTYPETKYRDYFFHIRNSEITTQAYLAPLQRRGIYVPGLLSLYWPAQQAVRPKPVPDGMYKVP